MRNILFFVTFSASVLTFLEDVDSHIPVPNYPNITTTPLSSSSSATTSPTKKTTTAAPTTTTEAPTTAMPPNSTTTAPSTTTAKPTPAPPKPPYNPQPGTWMANYTNSNVTCIVAQFAALFEIPYLINNNSASYIAYVNVPTDARATGTCNNNAFQKIQLSWNAIVNATNQVILVFEKKDNLKSFDLASVEVSIFPDNRTFPGLNNTDLITLYHRKVEFSTNLQKSYKCSKEQTFNLTEQNSEETRGYIHVYNVQLEAFRNTTGNLFSKAEDCVDLRTSAIIPIIVGCVLIVLVVIVLILYGIGRYRNQTRGYLSMFNQNRQETDYIPMKNFNCFS